MFIYILLLFVLSSLLFESQLFTLFNDSFDWIPFLHTSSVLFILITAIVLFRRRGQSTNYKLGFSLFGAMIVLVVPTLFYFPFGLIQLFSFNPMVAQIGFSVAFLVTLAALHGIIRGRWNWKIHEVNLEFEHLPAELDGLHLVQLSDIHVGSFFDHFNKVEKAIEKVNALNADYVLFTGDLVNNVASEMDPWIPYFSKIKAKIGKYSILGNHDYGDYVKWESDEARNSNLSTLIETHKKIGFTPLLNENVSLSTSENEAYLIGVENWGKAPFRQSGKLQEALERVPEKAFKLLLSHDPSHFDEQVVGTGIDLTLSGHTHGMQFGIERFGIKFSPVQWRYKKWAGLYQVGKQFLYVNRGFGYIGYPGRAGIYPEITSIKLSKK